MASTREVIMFWCHYNVLVNLSFLMPSVAGSSPYLVLNQFKRIIIGFGKHCGKDGSYKVLCHQELTFVYLGMDAAALTLDMNFYVFLTHFPFWLKPLTPRPLFFSKLPPSDYVCPYFHSHAIKLCKHVWSEGRSTFLWLSVPLCVFYTFYAHSENKSL